MHGMLRRAAVSAVPALLGLAVSPASALATPHTGQAAAGPVKGGREVHERLVQLPRSGTAQGRTAKTTADTSWSNGTGAGFAATPAAPGINGGTAWLARFSRIGPPIVGATNGIIASKGGKTTGNRVTSIGGVGIDNTIGGSTGFNEVVDGATNTGVSQGHGQGNAVAGKRR
jgi:hypothetical protein